MLMSSAKLPNGQLWQSQTDRGVSIAATNVEHHQTCQSYWTLPNSKYLQLLLHVR